jgi:hypothetical protein
MDKKYKEFIDLQNELTDTLNDHSGFFFGSVISVLTISLIIFILLLLKFETQARGFLIGIGIMALFGLVRTICVEFKCYKLNQKIKNLNIK